MKDLSNQRSWLLFSMLLMVGCLCVVLPSAAETDREGPPDEADEAALVERGEAIKNTMRQPWTRTEGGYIREWLVCGPFPNPEQKEGEIVGTLTRHVVGAGYEKDYLATMGGERNAEPRPGEKVSYGEQQSRTWQRLSLQNDVIDFKSVFTGEPGDFVVAYAYATVTRETPGRAFLAIGSDDSVKAWVNHKLVHDHRVGRGVNKDDDIVPVDLVAGENRILFKVENIRGGWGLVARLLSESQFRSLDAGDIRPELRPPSADEPARLTINTDAGSGNLAKDGTDVLVEAVAAGGKVTATRKAKRGEKVELNTSRWQDGAYEIRLTHTRGDGSKRYAHLPWYKGDQWYTTIHRFAEDVEALPPSVVRARRQFIIDYVSDRFGVQLPLSGGDRTPSELDSKANRGSRPPVTEVDRLPYREVFGVNGWRNVHSVLMEANELDDSSAIRPHGFVRMAWKDDIDDSFQFCRSYLPPDYEPKAKSKRWPMVVVLHGYNPRNPPYIGWWSIDSRHNPIAERHNVIVLEPHGRGNTGYSGIGERDILRCIDEAKKRFRVDEDRIYLMGYSMGGGGTWYLGTRHPHTFAAIGPIYGGWDYRVWSDPEQLAKLTDWQHLMNQNWSSFAQAEALLTTPTFINHGDADELVDVEHSRYAAKLLQRWGYPVRYWEHPGLGHGKLGCEDELVRWMLQSPLNGNPRQVRVRAMDLQHARAHWVAVTRREDPMRFIVAHTRVTDPHTIVVDSDNAARLLLTPGEKLIDRSKPVRVIWNGEEANDIRVSKDGGIELAMHGGEPGAALAKTPECEGPIGRAMERPFMLVVGTTSKDPKMRAYCRRRGEAERDHWMQWQHCPPRFKLDNEVTDKDIASYSLVLFGGPDDNAVTKKLSSHLPLKLSPEGVMLDGRMFKAENAGVVMVYTHPGGGEKLIQVRAGNTAAGMYFTDRFEDFADYHIVDAHIATWGGDVPAEHVAVATGRFGPNWKLDERYLIEGKPRVRAETPQRKAPGVISAKTDSPKLMLSDLLESRASGSFNVMMRDMNWRGEPMKVGGESMSSGIAVQAWHEPCWVEYDLESAGWSRLKGKLGIDLSMKPDELEEKHKRGTQVFFRVLGDGEELYRSPMLTWESTGPVTLDVDITGVKTLRLEVGSGSTWHSVVSSMNWGEVRLEK